MNFPIFLSCLFFCSCNCFRVEPKISKNKEIITKSTISNIVNGFPAFNRHFFAKVRNFRNGDFCGASVLDDWWVITTATCVLLSDKFEVFVEINNFSRRNTVFRAFMLKRIVFSHSILTFDNLDDAVALLQLRDPIEEHFQPFLLMLQSRVLPICIERALQGDVIGTCGMGSIS
ncbi:coagulation factor IX-like, partial [Symsagittifera roscoffensis]|uniref:coagulation factor IX-like n=1 Tax=Symsagittifera roscoffensis TaxID=84072 RepID=UPI00307C690E